MAKSDKNSKNTKKIETGAKGIGESLKKLNLKIELKANKKEARAIKEAKPEAKENKQEDKEADFEEQMQRESGFRSPEWRVSGETAPVLKASKTPIAEQAEAGENLESQVRRAAPAASPAVETSETKEKVYITAVPKYAGGTGDYSARSSYENFVEQERNIIVNREVDITGGRMIHNARAPVLEERRAMNISAWESEHPFVRGKTIAEASRGEMARSGGEEYQVLGKKERKEKGKLPFQE